MTYQLNNYSTIHGTNLHIPYLVCHVGNCNDIGYGSISISSKEKDSSYICNLQCSFLARTSHVYES